MTEVLFYILDDEAPNATQHFACRLTEKAHTAGHRVYVHAGDAAQVSALDQLLWTFRQGSFVPHATSDTITPDDDLTPVVIGHGEPPPGFDDISINLGGDVALFFSRFRRHMEVVAPTRREQARDAYRFFRDRGYELTTHQIRDAFRRRS